MTIEIRAASHSDNNRYAQPYTNVALLSCPEQSWDAAYEYEYEEYMKERESQNDGGQLQLAGDAE
jgi:hypothetical protein